MKPQLDFSENLNAPLFTLLKEVVSALDLEAYIIGGFVRDHLLGRTQKKTLILSLWVQGSNWLRLFKKNSKEQVRFKFLKPTVLR